MPVFYWRNWGWLKFRWVLFSSTSTKFVKFFFAGMCTKIASLQNTFIFSGHKDLYILGRLILFHIGVLLIHVFLETPTNLPPQSTPVKWCKPIKPFDFACPIALFFTEIWSFNSIFLDWLDHIEARVSYEPSRSFFLLTYDALSGYIFCHVNLQSVILLYESYIEYKLKNKGNYL